LGLFLDNFADMEQGFRNILHQMDFQSAKGMMHKIKSSAAMIGAARLSAMAGTIEHFLMRHDKKMVGRKVSDGKGTHRKSVDQEGTHRKSVDQEGTHRKSVDQEGTHRKSVDQEGTYRKGVDQEGTHRKSVDQEGTYRKGVDQEGTYQKGTDGIVEKMQTFNFDRKIDDFFQQLDRVIDASRQLKILLDTKEAMNQNRQSEKVKECGPVSLDKQLNLLLMFVRKHQPEECHSILDKIKHDTGNSVIIEEMAEVSMLIGRYRFREAEKQLSSLIEYCKGDI
ncbi:MAG: Hpt domain-containing protein, partial [Desulfamplus sp.]|nr:Hpt domain-containing protein [Desulfamplus sp.]